MSIKNRKGIIALSPLPVFLITYVVSSLVAGDFYKVPVSAAFLITGIFSLLITKGSVKERVDIFSRGAGNSGILLMIWIFILAGAFAGTAGDIGAVDATVNATLSIVPAKMLYAGLFLTACFISLSIGTSVGTIVALTPLAVGIASQTGSSYGFMAAIIVGGAFFGDNLSFISDTTIAATSAAGCEMKDKFRANLRIVTPAVIAVTVIYLFMGQNVTIQAQHESAQLVKTLPYLLVIALALTGMNVTLILAIGIAVNSTLGLCTGDFTCITLLESIGKGIGTMNELIIVTLLAGGVLETIRHNGGLDYLTELLSRRIKGQRSAQGSIAALVSLANLCTANNTIAIITTGEMASGISKSYGIPPKRTASLLDTFSCIIQSVIPYGAQLLMASGLSGISPAEIIPYLYYTFALAICSTAAILIKEKPRA